MSARSPDGLKRESGENPEQNPLLCFLLIVSMLSFNFSPLGLSILGRPRDNGISQKTYRDIV